MAAEAGPPEPVFVEHFEQRRPVGKNAKKLPASNFYLRDSLGRQHLAGQADAHGDAHYTYHNTKAFGARYGEVSCHNKKEMISYLDRIIQVQRHAVGLQSVRPVSKHVLKARDECQSRLPDRSRFRFV